MLAAAFWVSPLIASANERKTLSSPQEFESIGRSIAPPVVSYSTPAQPGSQNQNPILSSSAPPVALASRPATATYTVGASAPGVVVVGSPVYSSTGYLNKEVYEAPVASAPTLN